MKKIILALTVLLTVNTVFAYEYSPVILDDLKDGQKFEYCTKNHDWYKTPQKNCTVFTKFMTHGSGGFSEFHANNQAFDTGTTYEFFDGTKLIGYNAHELKFYELNFDGKKVIQKPLNEKEIGVLLPKAEIVKISDFKDRKITLKKPWFKKKTFLLLNDTDEFFYKYQFEGYSDEFRPIYGIFDINHPQTLIFSHFKSRDTLSPVLKIKVRNSGF